MRTCDIGVKGYFGERGHIPVAKYPTQRWIEAMTVYPPLGRGALQQTAMQTALEGTRSVRMTADQYLANILRREAVPNGINSPVRGVIGLLRPQIVQWGGRFLAGFVASGSFIKGTANSSGTDIDLFLSLKPETQASLSDIYESLFRHMQGAGYAPKRQNVSINIKVGNYDVDLVPGRRQNSFGTDHSIYRRRADTWTQTNIMKHINYVREAKRIAETRIIKLWRSQKGLEFPSFYLELTVIDALHGAHGGNLSTNVATVFEYLRDRFEYARVVDPANTNNIVSDDLSAHEQAKVAAEATRALGANWNEVVW